MGGQGCGAMASPAEAQVGSRDERREQGPARSGPLALMGSGSSGTLLRHPSGGRRGAGASIVPQASLVTSSRLLRSGCSVTVEGRIIFHFENSRICHAALFPTR